MMRSAALFWQLLLRLCRGLAVDDSLRAGLLALQRGDLDVGAKQSGSGQRSSTPRDGRVWVALSQTYWRLHKDADADEAAGKAAALAPEDPAVLQGLAIYYSETHQTLKAAQAQAKYAAKVPANQPTPATTPLNCISKRRARCSTSRNSPSGAAILKRRRGAAAAERATGAGPGSGGLRAAAVR